MEDYQLRVIEEKEHLDVKRELLTKFVTIKPDTYINLEVGEKNDLKTQLSAMEVYSQALGRRIARFPAPKTGIEAVKEIVKTEQENAS